MYQFNLEQIFIYIQDRTLRATFSNVLQQTLYANSYGYPALFALTIHRFTSDNKNKNLFCYLLQYFFKTYKTSLTRAFCEQFEC